MRSARLTLMISTASLFALTACATHPVTIQHASGCADLVPEEWAKGVPSANYPADRGPLPKEPVAKADRLALDLTDARVFGNDQGAQLDKANGRTQDAIGIVKRCEARDQATAAKLSAPWWKGPFLKVPER